LSSALLSYVTEGTPARPNRRHGRRLGETTAALGRRYGIAKSTEPRLITEAGGRFTLSGDKAARLFVEQSEAALSHKDIAGRLGRNQSVVWHDLRLAGLNVDNGWQSATHTPIARPK
jgi:hypothetical protein